MTTRLLIKYKIINALFTKLFVFVTSELSSSIMRNNPDKHSNLSTVYQIITVISSTSKTKDLAF